MEQNHKILKRNFPSVHQAPHFNWTQILKKYNKK